MTGAGTVCVDVPADGVRRIRIVNPDRRGALSEPVLAGLTDALGATDDGARCLLLCSSGEAFSAGYDLHALSDPPDPDDALARIAPDRVAALDALEAQPLPVVVAVNGPALGGGLELVLGSDVRIAAAETVFGAPAGRIGLVYSPRGLERLLRELPFSVAAEVFLAGGLISARRARELGLVADVVSAGELEESALAAARRIAELAPGPARAHRAALRAARGERTLPAAAFEALAQAREAGMRSADFAEGVRAFCERRAPQFTGR